MPNEIDAQIEALLDITNNNYMEAVLLVCKNIELKSDKIVSDSSIN
jgi:predicted nucleic-acid-binding Zn-ribbon protein